MARMNVSFAGEDFFTLFHGGNPFHCGTLPVSFFLVQNFLKIDKTLKQFIETFLVLTRHVKLPGPAYPSVHRLPASIILMGTF
jgi:hypothetical protein